LSDALAVMMQKCYKG